MNELWSAQVLWFLAGAALLLAEMALPGFVLFFFALGAFAAALGSFFVGTGGQIIVFLAASAAGLALLRRVFLKVFRGAARNTATDAEDPGLDDSGAGKAAVATRAFGPGQSGEIRYRGTFWRAVSAEPVAQGQDVVIVGPAPDDAGTYLVRPAAKTAQP